MQGLRRHGISTYVEETDDAREARVNLHGITIEHQILGVGSSVDKNLVGEAFKILYIALKSCGVGKLKQTVVDTTLLSLEINLLTIL